ncbi:hypothetical protein E3T37_05235 [Cryobacterium sp. TMT2-10]|uniref:DUF5719 family protein n=1 Tax=Cryobacterium sp. TMT2-10 TaxID=1259244 RepID=UPI00106926DE|nr:DUF5719 family protein [Cryobacterium sp. TMT2-10]TFD40741.1 hypothetical protein E3T37_05235 [Cryobacterium sp. TMT2-10]
MLSKRGIALFGARALVGAVGLVIVVAGVGAAAVVPWPTLEKAPPSVLVSPTPSEQQRVCPGPLLTLAEDSTQAQAASSVGSAEAVYATRSVASGAGWTDPEVSPLTAPDNAKGDIDGAPLLLRVPVEAGVDAAPLVSGSQSETVASETLGGLAIAACSEAASDSWLVGGSTDIGRTSLVLLSNPTTVTATVDLTVFGETGQVDAPGSTGILVQAGSQRIVSLAGLAPNLRSPVVHVQSRGGQVTANLQQSIVRGIAPGGVDVFGASSGPGRTQTIAGLLITAEAPEAAPTEAGGLADGVPSVRVLVPGDLPATVEVGVTSADGSAPGTSVQIEVQPGLTTEVPLTGLAPGMYSAALVSDQPIVAAAQSSSAGAPGRDFAWFTASDTLDEEFLVSVASGPVPTLVLVNTGGSAATYTVSPRSGEPATVDVAEGRTATLPLTAGGSYVVSGGSSTVASVTYAGDGLMASFPLSQAGPLAAPIRVYSH